MPKQNGHAKSDSAALRSEESSEDVLDSLTQKMASALGSLGDDCDHEVDTWTKDERVNTVFGEFGFFARRENDSVRRVNCR